MVSTCSLPDLAPGAAIDWPAIEAFLAPIVSASELAATPQDAKWHAEGDVWTHTKLALAALVAAPAYAAADPAARPILAAAVLLHDLGKPSTTRSDGEAITSRGHSARGEHLARAALWRLGLPFDAREHVCALIRSHQIPFFGIDKPDAERLAIRLSLALRHDWLVAVAEADGSGRRCADPADQARILDQCTLWRQHTAELGILDRAKAFASDHTRRLYFESGRAPDVAAYDDTTCEVVLMSGLPAAGKDRWLAEHRPELPVVSLDDLRTELEVDPGDSQAHVIAAARERARAYLRDHTSFAWNATNLSAALRGQLIDLARSYRARVHVVYCECPAAEQRERNRSRESPVPAAVIERMLIRWSVPDPSEAQRVSYAVGRAGTLHSWPPPSRVSGVTPDPKNRP